MTLHSAARGADMVARARRLGLVVPAFNVPYLPMMKPIVEAVRDEDSFAFVAVARLEWIKFESGSLEAVAEEYLRWKDVRHVRLHLDHTPIIDEDDLRVDYLPIIGRAVELGYDSVMVDGSRLPLEANILATRAAADVAHAGGLPLEAELGAVLGHEEGPRQSYEEIFASKRGFTDAGEAALFTRETGCDWLSVAVGSVHGAVSRVLRDTKKPRARLDLDRLRDIEEAAGIPLVLHGGSGVDPRDIEQAVGIGIAKVNIGTEIRQAYERALRETGDVERARSGVYAKTRSLIRDLLAARGTRARIELPP